MNFPHETVNSYLSGGNCLNLGVNPPNEVYFKEFLYLCLLLTTHENHLSHEVNQIPYHPTAEIPQ